MTSYTSATALVVVDCQNDFADPAGSLYVDGGEAIVAACNAQIIRATAAGAFVVYTQDWHQQSTPHFQKDGGIWPVHCLADTWGSQLHPRLVVAGPSVKKGANGEDGYSGFTMRDPVSGDTTPTELASILKKAEVDRVVVVGLALDYCVKTTALDATGLGYRTSVITSATAAVDLNPGDGQKSFDELRAAGVGQD
ncbi:MAG: isochorismatase family protein [Acidimicrobiia bacterium]